MPAKPTFGTVLIKRKANDRPKDWELRLRPICQKIRIVEKLSGGAHLMFTGSRLAVRIYNTDDFSRLEGTASSNDEESDGVDGLRSFRDSYEYSIVFFVLPSGQHQRDQLGRRDSFVNTAQKSLLWRDKKADENGKKKRMTRTAIVSDISQVIQTIDSWENSLSLDKKEKRNAYFAQVASKHFLPGAGAQPTQEVVANHVTKTFNAWAERLEMPEGDSQVVLSMLGSLASVATANGGTLDDVPIRNASKELVSSFFGATPDKEDKNEAQSNDEDQFYDDIDDSELLECPDPSTINQSEQPSDRTPFPHRNFQTTTNQPMLQKHQSFPGNIDFTPMVPSRLVEQPGYNATPSIFPESFTVQNRFSQPPSTGGHRHMMASHEFGYSSNNSNHVYGAGTSATGGIRQQQTQSFRRGTGSMQGYRDANYSQARYHTQQFM
ncbi:hypothetical protein ACHAXR_004654 [Thalassiosira sp. AJA248-18]